jgi:HK97 family phage major capsid protein
MNLAERIVAAQAALVLKKDALVEATKSLETSPNDDGILATVDQLAGEVEQMTKSLESLQRAEKALAERAAVAPAIIHSTGKSTDAVDLFAKQAVVAFLAHCEKKNPEQVLAERYKSNKALEAVLVAKSAVPLATTFDAGWAAELVQTDTRGFINLMVPTSVAAALAAKAVPLDFGGFDSVTLPRRNARGATGANMGGAWVGEGGAIPLGRMAIGASKLSRYKMGVISTFSKELARRSTPAIESIVRQAILDDMSVEMDAAFVGAGAAVAGVRPAGILNGVSAAAGTAGGGIDAVVADIKAAMGTLTGAGLGSRPVLIVNTLDAMSVSMMQTAMGEFLFAAEMNGGRLLGIEVIKSLNVPSKTMMLVDAATLATAFDTTEFDVSDVATVVEADSDGSAPTHAVTAAGVVGPVGQVLPNGGISANGLPSGAGTTGAVARSLWQTWSVGVRTVQPASWGLIQPGGVAAANTLTW